MFKRYLHRNYQALSSLKFRFGRRVTRVGWLATGAVFVAALLGLDTNLSLAYQTFAFLACLCVAAFFAVFLNHVQFSAERILPRFGSAGETLSYQVVIRNKTRRIQRALVLMEETQDPRPSLEEFVSTPEPGEEKRNWYDRTYGYYRWQWLITKNRQAAAAEQPLPALPSHVAKEVKVEIVPLKRGYLRFTGMTLAAPDPFGMFRTLKTISLPQSLLILPKRYELPPIDLPGAMKYQQGGVALASAVGESEEFVALRDYRPGDPLRHIHWKSFAKAGKPIVKEFQDEFFVRHALILDTFHPYLHCDIFEEAVSVAASFAYTIQTRDSLLDLMFVGPQAYCFTSGRGVGHTEQMLEILASVQVCRDKSFATLQQLVLEHLTTVSGCICIFLAWDEERKDFVEQLKVMGMPLLVFVITETEATLEPGPMADEAENFHVLPVGKIAERLAQL